jgi:hypothetical protein
MRRSKWQIFTGDLFKSTMKDLKNLGYAVRIRRITRPWGWNRVLEYRQR